MLVNWTYIPCYDQFRPAASTSTYFRWWYFWNCEEENQRYMFSYADNLVKVWGEAAGQLTASEPLINIQYHNGIFFSPFTVGD